MTRLEKKCFLVSAGMHGLLGIILLGTSAFRDKPVTREMPILTLIPSRILDQAGAGGNPAPSVAPQLPQSAPPAAQAPQPVAPQPQPVAPQHVAQVMERPKPREIVREPAPEPVIAKEAVARPVHKAHEIQVDYTPASSVTHKTKTKTSESAVAESSPSSSRNDSRRIKELLADSFGTLAGRVQNSGARGTVVESPGQGGGESFAGYETVIYNVYFHAWTTPDSIADRLAGADVKIVVARDGTIISAEIISKSGERALDRSVERALQEVTRLPPFPASAHDEQRSFRIRFSLEAKEGSG